MLTFAFQTVTRVTRSSSNVGTQTPRLRNRNEDAFTFDSASSGDDEDTEKAKNANEIDDVTDGKARSVYAEQSMFMG